MEEEKENNGREETRTKSLKLEWNKLLPGSDEGNPPELVVVGGRNKEQQPSSSSPHTLSLKDDLRHLTDHALNDTISRLKGQIHPISSRLPDKGAKLRESLTCHLAEQRRRNLLRSKKSEDEDEKEMPSRSQRSSRAANSFRSGSSSSQGQSQSSFTSLLSKKLEKELDRTPPASDAFEKEFSYLGHSKPKMLNKLRQENRANSRQSPFKSPITDYPKRDKHRLSEGSREHNTIPTFNFYSPRADDNMSRHFSKRKKAFQNHTFSGSKSKKEEAVVLVDEEDCDPMETTQQKDKPLEWIKEAKFYYPSRDDPEAVELCYADIECLSPEAFLSSTIMNFYIRYLHRPVSATGKSRVNYHFFNTYFYEKLKKAVSYKRSDKDKVFAKLRRWWRGVNIFEKAYILLPIHDNLHWSLVIICIPDKEDDSGLTLLHLDSLGCHDSSQIFRNIKSFLKDEWNYLNQEIGSLDLPIADKTWENLPQRIDANVITVPQQKNDYDCGIFVLFFIERFIVEAPDRLRKSDIAMFGRQWFKPEEASRLRERIRKLLLEEFQISRIETDTRESSPSSSSSLSGSDDSEECTILTTNS